MAPRQPTARLIRPASSTLASNASGQAQGSVVTYPATATTRMANQLPRQRQPEAAGITSIRLRLVSDPSITHQRDEDRDGETRSRDWWPRTRTSPRAAGRSPGRTARSAIEPARPSTPASMRTVRSTTPSSIQTTRSPSWPWNCRRCSARPPAARSNLCLAARRPPAPAPAPDQGAASPSTSRPTGVHGRVSIWLKCSSPPTGITASARAKVSGPVLASGVEQDGLNPHLGVNTRLLPTNHVSRLVVALVYTSGQQLKPRQVLQAQG